MSNQLISPEELAKQAASAIIQNSNISDLLRYFQFNEASEIDFNNQVVLFLQKEFNLEDLIHKEIKEQAIASSDQLASRVETIHESQSLCSEIESGHGYRYVHDGIESENSYKTPVVAQKACINKLIGFKQFYKD